MFATLGPSIAASASHGFPWATCISAVVAAVGLTALWASLDTRRRAETARLLERFDAKEFHVRMWRMEQLTRQGKDATHIEAVDIDELREQIKHDANRRTILNDALATDWSSNRVDTQSLYFFALEMRNTLSRWSWFALHGARRLNRTFGYQLLSTYLDQQIVAWRLLPSKGRGRMDDDQRRTYYADNYGLTDPRYVELVDWLATDLLGKRGVKGLPDEARRRLKGKHEAIAEASHLHRASVTG